MAKKSKGAANARKQGKLSLRLGAALFVPLILVLAVIPLIVQMNLITLPENVRAFWTQNQAADFFSFYKSRALILTAIYMLCVFGYYKAQGLQDHFAQNRSMYLYFGAVAVFALFAILSTVFSDYKSIAMWGGPERCEGLGMISFICLSCFMHGGRTPIIPNSNILFCRWAF